MNIIRPRSSSRAFIVPVVLAAGLFATSQLTFALCGPGAQPVSDTTFSGLGSDAPIVDAFLVSSSNPPPARAMVSIGRVVGSGLPSDFDPSTGFLTDASYALYTSNGALSKTASVALCWEASIDDTIIFAGSPTEVWLNNQLVASFPFPESSDQTQTFSIEISTRYLKFPQRVPGGTPTPAINNFGFAAVNPKGGIYGDGVINNSHLIAYAVQTLSIEAMAPVILVHGWNSGPWWWGPPGGAAVSGSNPDGCGVDAAYDLPGHGGFKGGLDFIQPFIADKISFHCSIQVGAQDLVEGGGAELEPLIIDAAGEFGAKHVHLVGHSKGGLWIRAALPLLANETDPARQIGVYSVTTVDTPHLGSSLADLLVMAHEHPLLGLENPKLFEGLFKRFDNGALDLQTGAATKTNSEFPPPYAGPGLTFTADGVLTWAQYFSVAADADLNLNGKVDGAEGCPYNSLAANRIYQFLGNTKSVTLTPVTVLGRTIGQKPTFNMTTTFQKNDMAVTVPSAQFIALDGGQPTGYVPLAPPPGLSGSITPTSTSIVQCSPAFNKFVQSGPTPYFPGNHKTVGSPTLSMVAQTIIENIQSLSLR
jgi:hypothetical protein